MNPIPAVFLGLLSIAQGPTPLSLDRALELASANRPAVHSARLRLEQARLSRRSLTAQPTTRLDINATSNRELRTGDDDIILAQPIDLFGRRTANRALGDAQVLLAEAGLRQTMADVQAEVIDRYTDAAAATLLSRAASSQLDLAERLLDATRRRAEGGAVPPVQVSRVGIEVERARQTVALRKSAEAAALKRLAGAMGQADSSVSVDSFADLASSPTDLQSFATQRADLMSIRANLAVAQANARVSRAGGRPELEVSLNTSAWTWPGDNQTGIRATLSIPIFDHGRVRNDIRAAQAQVEAEREALDDATQLVQTELQAVTIEAAAAKDQLAGFERLLTELRDLVRVSEIGYREGASTLLDILEATRSLREVEENQIEARQRLAQAQAGVLKTTGRLLGGLR